jgi:UDP-N-acetylmuramyl pentapeptide synthase
LATSCINFIKCIFGEKIAVLGDMAELGNNTKTFHQEIGQLAKNTLDKVYT